MMSSKSILELIPIHHVISRKHPMIMIPPHMSWSAKLLRGIACLVRFGIRSSQWRKLGLDCANRSVRVKWLVRFSEQWGLRTEKVLVAHLLHLISMMPTSRLLLSLHQLPQNFSLSGKNFCNTRGRWRWRWIAIPSGSKTTGTASSWSNHLKRE